MENFKKFVSDLVEKASLNVKQEFQSNENVLIRTEKHASDNQTEISIEMIAKSLLNSDDYGLILSVVITSSASVSQTIICTEINRSFGPILKSNELSVTNDTVFDQRKFQEILEETSRELIKLFKQEYL